MKKLTYFLLSLLSFTSFAQNNFQEGYVIKNDGNKKVIFIRNNDWNNNPTQISYKETENGAIEIIEIENIAEFGIGENFKFKRFTTDIDFSSTNSNKLSEKSTPEWKKQTVLLKILVQGETNLYQFDNGNLVRYFFGTGKKETVEPLIYRQYLEKSNQAKTDNTFRSQLYTLMKSANFSVADFRRVDYKKNDLIAIFEKYNHTKSENYFTFSKKQNISSFNLKAVAGLSKSQIEFSSLITRATYDFGNQSSLKIGLEAECILPFNNNKWSIFIDPNYQYFKADKQVSNFVASLDYKYLEIPIGVRHYFFLNDKSKIFINAGYSVSFSLNSKMNYASQKSELSKATNYFAGIGYSYQKFALEARFNTKKKLTKNETLIGEQKGFNFGLSYSFL